MCPSMVDINLRPLRLGEENKRKIETTEQKYNGLPYSIGRLAYLNHVVTLFVL